jgi:hypothetical protein
MGALNTPWKNEEGHHCVVTSYRKQD